jgi:ribonuclease P protein component
MRIVLGNETNVAAQEAQTRTHARLFAPQRLPHRPPHARTPPPQGPRTPLGITMARTHRLSHADFKTLRPAQRLHGRFFSLSIAPHGSGIKWACVVSKKVAAKAVTRNLIKRRSRSTLTPLLKHARAPHALVFTAKRGAAEATFAELKNDLHELARRAGLVGAN